MDMTTSERRGPGRPRGATNRLIHQRDTAIIRLFDDGRTPTQLARDFALTPQRIYGILRDRGRVTKRAEQQAARPHDAEIVAQWRTGRTASDLGREYGISREAVRMILKRNGIASTRHEPKSTDKICKVCGESYPKGAYPAHYRAKQHPAMAQPRVGASPRELEIASAYKSGEPIGKIAERFGVTPSDVYLAGGRVYGRTRYENARGGNIEDRWWDVFEAFDKGIANWWVVENLGVSRNYVSYLRRRWRQMREAVNAND